jgi:hypothetical protein
VNRFKQWFIYSTTGILLGALLGFVLGWLWFFFRLFILGYGDSGPSWINTVTDFILGGGIVIGSLGGQLLFFIVCKNEKKQQHDIN